MFLTSCFYILFAFVCLCLFKIIRKRKLETTEKVSEGLANKENIKKCLEDSTTDKTEVKENKEITLESFILKEIENSVYELQKKRAPFKNIDLNVEPFNPHLQDYIPKTQLNPLAQDFCPY
jgi:CRISPR/Cas system CSM-associated protein Csm5 (group 7 of RAMP superfamily)